jgi:uncharacterized protein (DUF433 family)
MSTEKQYQHLERRPCSMYRQLFIKGTRIRAEIVYRACDALEELRRTPEDEDDQLRTPEQVAVDYGLPLEAVLEAIDYCRSNPPEIAADHAREERLMQASGMNHPDYKNNPKKYYKTLTPQEWARLDDDPLPG